MTSLPSIYSVLFSHFRRNRGDDSLPIPLPLNLSRLLIQLVGSQAGDPKRKEDSAFKQAVDFLLAPPADSSPLPTTLLQDYLQADFISMLSSDEPNEKVFSIILPEWHTPNAVRHSFIASHSTRDSKVKLCLSCRQSIGGFMDLCFCCQRCNKFVHASCRQAALREQCEVVKHTYHPLMRHFNPAAHSSTLLARIFLSLIAHENPPESELWIRWFAELDSPHVESSAVEAFRRLLAHPPSPGFLFARCYRDLYRHRSLLNVCAVLLLFYNHLILPTNQPAEGSPLSSLHRDLLASIEALFTLLLHIPHPEMRSPGEASFLQDSLSLLVHPLLIRQQQQEADHLPQLHLGNLHISTKTLMTSIDIFFRHYCPAGLDRRASFPNGTFNVDMPSSPKRSKT